MNMFEDSCGALRILVDFNGKATQGPPSVIEFVLREAGKITATEGRELEVVAHFGASRHPALPDSKRRDHLAQARTLARRIGEPSDKLDSVDLMTDALMALDEHALAIPWANRAAALTQRNASAAASRLWRAGRCYARAGFKREAQEPLRAAAALLREKPDSPILPHALLDYGNACLELDPAEAEPAYAEAGELWSAAGQVNQAATAWLNLGVLCSRAERVDEALAWYEKVLEARKDDPAATVAQLGNIHNNLASAWRRKRDFERARDEANQALEILKGAPGLALSNALGTMGEIRRDEGFVEEALDWFTRAREEFERQPSPSVDGLATKLENEAGALETLGRTDEAAKARARVAELKGIAAPAAPPLPKAKPAATAGRRDEGAVIVTLDGQGLPDEVYRTCDLATLESRLETRLEQEGGGELDGHEHGPEATQLFLYGPDARALFDTIAPILRDYPLCRGARVELRQGKKTEEFGL